MGFQPLSLICGLETTINQSFLSMGFQPLQISSLWAQNHRATFCGLKTTKQLHFVDLQPLFFKKSRNYYRFLWVPFLSGILWLFFTILAALCHGYFHTSSLCRATTLGIHPFFNRGSICVAFGASKAFGAAHLCIPGWLIVNLAIRGSIFASRVEYAPTLELVFSNSSLSDGHHVWCFTSSYFKFSALRVYHRHTKAGHPPFFTLVQSGILLFYARGVWPRNVLVYPSLGDQPVDGSICTRSAPLATRQLSVVPGLLTKRHPLS